MTNQEVNMSSQEFEPTTKQAKASLLDNPYLLGVALVSPPLSFPISQNIDRTKQFASLGGFLFGYDQGVVSGVLTMESFGSKFPKIYADAGFKGWWVSIILLSESRSVFQYYGWGY
jgi:hypothetical protein